MVNTIIGIGALVGGLATGSPLLATAGTVTGSVGALQFAYKTMKERIGRG
jgi:hypothetical protein